MSETGTKTVTVERDLPFAPEKVWRALTVPHLLAEWLMQSDFAPAVDHRFRFTADWGAVDCKVLEVEPGKRLAYTWDAMGLNSVVTFTLSPTSTGTHLRMEQEGFKPGMGQAYAGAKVGWNNFFDKLAVVLENEA